ncbi:MAG: hypothetical protein J0H68_02920 [Sphingobacteriia bacterium]|nr:hypothetical protein [Sphingobacteriia bacterium]
MKFALYFNEVIYKGLLNILGVKKDFYILSTKNIAPLTPQRMESLLSTTNKTINKSWLEYFGNLQKDNQNFIFSSNGLFEFKNKGTNKFENVLSKFSPFDVDTEGRMLYLFLKSQIQQTENSFEEKQEQLKLFMYTVFRYKEVTKEDIERIILKFLNQDSFSIINQQSNVSIEIEDIVTIIRSYVYHNYNASESIYSCKEAGEQIKNIKSIFKVIEDTYKNDREKLNFLECLKKEINKNFNLKIFKDESSVKHLKKYSNLLKHQRYQLEHEIDIKDDLFLSGEENYDRINDKKRTQVSFIKHLAENPQIAKKALFANFVKNTLDKNILNYRDIGLLVGAIITIIGSLIGIPLVYKNVIRFKTLFKTIAATTVVTNLGVNINDAYTIYKNHMKDIKNMRTEIQNQQAQIANENQL